MVSEINVGNVVISLLFRASKSDMQYDILQQYIDDIVTTSTVRSPFRLVTGEMSLDEIVDRLGVVVEPYRQADMLVVRDFSSQIGRQHLIPVAADPSKDLTKKLQTDYAYVEIGAREINEWLVRGSLSAFKIVIIEHIDRLTLSSANALLKSLEEPVSGRLIVGTTRHVSSVLPTLISRAYVIPCREPVDSFANRLTSGEGRQAVWIEWIQTMSQGRVAMVSRLAACRAGDHAMSWSEWYDGALRHAEEQGQWGRVQSLVRLQQHLSANVNPESAMLSCVVGW